MVLLFFVCTMLFFYQLTVFCVLMCLNKRAKCDNVNACLRKVCSEGFYSLKCVIIVKKNKADYLSNFTCWGLFLENNPYNRRGITVCDLRQTLYLYLYPVYCFVILNSNQKEKKQIRCQGDLNPGLLHEGIAFLFTKTCKVLSVSCWLLLFSLYVIWLKCNHHIVVIREQWDIQFWKTECDHRQDEVGLAKWQYENVKNSAGYWTHYKSTKVQLKWAKITTEM